MFTQENGNAVRCRSERICNKSLDSKQRFPTSPTGCRTPTPPNRGSVYLHLMIEEPHIFCSQPQGAQRQAGTRSFQILRKNIATGMAIAWGIEGTQEFLNFGSRNDPNFWKSYMFWIISRWKQCFQKEKRIEKASPSSFPCHAWDVLIFCAASTAARKGANLGCLNLNHIWLIYIYSNIISNII